MSLAACPGCARHVRRTETACPFCGSALSLPPAPVRGPLPRLGRTATFAFGAALSTTAAACSTPSTTEDTGPELEDVGFNDVAVYGGPDAGPADAGGGTTDAPSATDAPDDAGIDTGEPIGPLYGGPPLDAGIRNEDTGGGAVPLYGGPPAD
jgi:hypothetical protein